MNQPRSISTLATFDVIDELRGFLHSTNLTFPGIPTYIACDSLVDSYLKDKYTGQHKLITFCCLDKYSGKGRHLLEAQGLFLELLSMKMTIMRMAVNNEGDTLYMDSDVIVIRQFDVNTNYSVQLSKAYVSRQIQDETGKYNAGYIWTNSLPFLKKWQDSLIDSLYYDQHILQSVIQEFPHTFFHRGHNIMPWRLITPETSCDAFINSINSYESYIRVKNHILVSIHTHFNRSDMKAFNKLIVRCLMISNCRIGLEALSKITFNV
jgi:hypothetical protein